MKKVLFCLQTLVRGGVEKELLIATKILMKRNYEITVAVLYDSNHDMINELTDIGVKVINLGIDREYYCSGNKKMFLSRLSSGHVLEAIVFALKFLFKKGCPETNISLRDVPGISERFDYAVCYHIHSPIMVKYVVEKIISTHRIAWIHNDFSTTGYCPQRIINLLEKYDLIAAVSKQVRNEFLELCPGLHNKTKLVYNILDKEDIIKKSLDEVDDDRFKVESGLSVLTIGRLTEQKGIDIAVDACSNLVNEGYKVRWYVIGDGEDYGLLSEKIEKLDLSSNFILLGEKKNPYPYLRECDIYVQPSRHEGYGLAVAEARILKKPIISTDFAGALEQLENQRTGIVIERENVEALVNAVKKLEDKKSRVKMSNNLADSVSYKNDILELLACFDL